MTAVFFIFLLVLDAMETSSSVGHRRVKRSFANFDGMIRCVLGGTSIPYLNYGCFCGLGGSGTPVDDIDGCCKQHDDCYGAAMSLCTNIGMYFVHYEWDCKDGRITCSSECFEERQIEGKRRC
ncbi:phospholipase A2 [Oesophagostomum dentatum]|uniref:Phospholipase A2 n=1 Tax=Oesophagostomum dentatum TaxID=61180 RepID=A0A0B1S9C2_OESDE|nr:phospholipase A2 [Oesophagostomum dentatum]